MMKLAIPFHRQRHTSSERRATEQKIRPVIRTEVPPRARRRIFSVFELVEFAEITLETSNGRSRGEKHLSPHLGYITEVSTCLWNGPEEMIIKNFF